MSTGAFIEGTHVPVDLPLHVTEVSPPAGRAPDRPADTFVLLHGFGGSSFTWEAWAPRLSGRGRVLCVDLKGFGAAPKPADDAYAPADHAALVVAMVDELGLDRITLVGHSLGGGISLLVASTLLSRDPTPLRRLVLVSSPAYRQRLPPFAPLSRRPRFSRALFSAVGPRRVVRSVIRSIVYDRSSVTERQVEAYTRPLESREGLDALMRTGARIMPDDIDDTVRRIPSIDIPVLLLWGDTERVVPGWVGERLHRELPDSELVVLPECGHIPPEEKPEESFAALAAFLDRTDD